MAQFIQVTMLHNVTLRINVDHLEGYHPDELSDEPGVMGTTLWARSDHPLQVRETSEEIDRLINPTGTR